MICRASEPPVGGVMPAGWIGVWPGAGISKSRASKPDRSEVDSEVDRAVDVENGGVAGSNRSPKDGKETGGRLSIGWREGSADGDQFANRSLAQAARSSC